MVAVALLAALPAAAQTAQEAAESVVVTSGEGIVEAVPDRAFVNIAAESRAANPRDAQRRNAELMKPVIDKLRAAGVPENAIRTVGYDLHIEYDWIKERRVPKGYVARNTVEVRVDDIGRLGEILDMAVSAGATSVDGIRFALKDQDKLEREALRLAVADARARADAAAAGIGRSVDRVIRIEERGMHVPPPMPMMRSMAMQEAKDVATPIAAGQIEIRADVSVTASLK